MPGENYDEYRVDNSDVTKSEIDSAINHAKSDLGDLQSEVLGGKKIDFKTPDSINNFYELDKENGKVIFKLNQVKSYLNDVYQRLSGMKIQKFGEVSKENNFTGTILAIQIALKAIDSKKYNIKINGKYKDSKDDPTRNAIKQFQIDKRLQGKDGKPGKETIGTLIKELDNFLNKKKLEREENKKIKKDIADIIEESINFNPYSGLYTREEKEAIVNYILSGKLNSNGDKDKQIKRLSEHVMNWKLKYLIENSKEPLKNNIENIKEMEKRGRNGLKKHLDEINQQSQGGGDRNEKENKEVFQKAGNNISDAMFMQILAIEGHQNFNASANRNLGESFVTGPYGQVYKHIDSKGNRLKKKERFHQGERVPKEWALKNAKAQLQDSSDDWKKWFKMPGLELNYINDKKIKIDEYGINESDLKKAITEYKTKKSNKNENDKIEKDGILIGKGPYKLQAKKNNDLYITRNKMEFDQNMLDSVVCASMGGAGTRNDLRKIIFDSINKNGIRNKDGSPNKQYIKNQWASGNFRVKSGGKRRRGLVARREFEADRFMGERGKYIEYQNKYNNTTNRKELLAKISGQRKGEVVRA